MTETTAERAIAAGRPWRRRVAFSRDDPTFWDEGEAWTLEQRARWR